MLWQLMERLVLYEGKWLQMMVAYTMIFVSGGDWYDSFRLDAYANFEKEIVSVCGVFDRWSGTSCLRVNWC